MIRDIWTVIVGSWTTWWREIQDERYAVRELRHELDWHGSYSVDAIVNAPLKYVEAEVPR